MNRRLFAGVMAALSCTLAITIVSCTGDRIADAPSQPVRDGENQRVLAEECSGILAVERCATGGASASYDPLTGVLSVTDATNLASGIQSTFAPAHDGKVEIDADAPQGDQQFSVVAYDNGTEQGRLDITQDPHDATRTALTPAFNAGDGIYRVEVYNNGEKVAAAEGVQPGTRTYASYFRLPRWLKWIIRDLLFAKQRDKGAHMNAAPGETGACVWVAGSSSEDAVDVRLPDGTIVQGDEIRFIEEVDGSGRYPYHSVDRLDVLSNIGSFDILSEQIGN